MPIQQNSILTRQNLVRVLPSAIAFLPVWFLSSYLLWRLYDIQQLIVAGDYSHAQAVHLVSTMGLIITVLVIAVWVYTDLRHRAGTYWRCTWKVAAQTMLVLGIYGAAVVIRRESWRPNQGLSDDAMFLPFIGTTNAAFFSEYGWLIYFLEIVPIISLVSGLSYQLKMRLTGNLQIRRR